MQRYNVHVARKPCMCVWSAIATKKWHGRPVDTTAKEGDAVSLGRPLGTMKEAGDGVSQVSCESTVEGRSMWCDFGETCGYHSRLEGYGVCPGEACLC